MKWQLVVLLVIDCDSCILHVIPFDAWCCQDIGAGKGKYYAVNFPLRDGIDDDSYEQVFRPVCCAHHGISAVLLWYQMCNLLRHNLTVFCICVFVSDLCCFFIVFCCHMLNNNKPETLDIIRRAFSSNLSQWHFSTLMLFYCTSVCWLRFILIFAFSSTIF